MLRIGVGVDVTVCGVRVVSVRVKVDLDAPSPLLGWFMSGPVCSVSVVFMSMSVLTLVVWWFGVRAGVSPCQCQCGY